MTATMTRKDRALTRVSKAVAKYHVALNRRTGGRLGNRFRGGDVLLLTHRGRTSSHGYATPVLHVRDGEDFVVVASNGGIDAEPQWWLNLQADPHGVAEVRGRRTDVLPTPVAEEDQQRLWDALMARTPTDEKYQASVSRRISLVRLTPAG